MQPVIDAFKGLRPTITAVILIAVAVLSGDGFWIETGVYTLFTTAGIALLLNGVKKENGKWAVKNHLMAGFGFAMTIGGVVGLILLYKL